MADVLNNLVLCLALSVVASACYQDDAIASMESPGLRLEIGTGETRFEPLAEGQTVALVAGVQGGYHVWISTRVYGLSAERALLRITTIVEDWSDEPLPHEINAFFRAHDEYHELIGFPARMRRERCTPGRHVRFEVEVEDRLTAETGHDSRRLLIDPKSQVRGSDVLTQTLNDCPDTTSPTAS